MIIIRMDPRLLVLQIQMLLISRLGTTFFALVEPNLPYLPIMGAFLLFFFAYFLDSDGNLWSISYTFFLTVCIPFQLLITRVLDEKLIHPYYSSLDTKFVWALKFIKPANAQRFRLVAFIST